VTVATVAESYIFAYAFGNYKSRSAKLLPLPSYSVFYRWPGLSCGCLKTQWATSRPATARRCGGNAATHTQKERARQLLVALSLSLYTPVYSFTPTLPLALSRLLHVSLLHIGLVCAWHRDCSLSLARALEARRCDWSGFRVLELGSGLGLVAMTLACLGVIPRSIHAHPLCPA
jgi:hypothetical protein